MGVRIKLRRDTSTNWQSVNPVLDEGEPGFELDNFRLKIGNGTSTWNNLPYLTTGFIESDRNPTISDVYPEGFLWFNKTNGWLFVSLGNGDWYSNFLKVVKNPFKYSQWASDIPDSSILFRAIFDYTNDAFVDLTGKTITRNSEPASFVPQVPSPVGYGYKFVGQNYLVVNGLDSTFFNNPYTFCAWIRNVGINTSSLRWSRYVDWQGRILIGTYDNTNKLTLGLLTTSTASNNLRWTIDIVFEPYEWLFVCLSVNNHDALDFKLYVNGCDYTDRLVYMTAPLPDINEFRFGRSNWTGGDLPLDDACIGSVTLIGGVALKTEQVQYLYINKF